MNKLLEYISKIRKHGIKESLDILWKRKIDIALQRLMLQFVKKNPLKNTIIIASHNDFDTNGGAFYDYLIAHGYNKKYKIVWLCKNLEYIPEELPENVVCYPWNTPNWRRDMDICTAKYFLADDWIQEKVRPEQMSLYCTHGIGGLKNVHGKIWIPKTVDYILASTEEYNPILAYQFSLPYPNKRFVSLGYPLDDLLYEKDKSEIRKITQKNFSKIVLWMPTFRKHKSGDRVDGTKEQPLGIPLLRNINDYNELNAFLSKRNMLLIIKLHPMQDIQNIAISSLSNIEVLDADSVKAKRIDNYRLMRCTDALISDYSSAAADYLHLDRPIAYVFDDIDEYKLGLVYTDLDKYTAGEKIYTYADFYHFIESVAIECDKFVEKRDKLRKFIFQYHDGKSCERLADFLNL